MDTSGLVIFAVQRDCNKNYDFQEYVKDEGDSLEWRFERLYKDD